MKNNVNPFMPRPILVKYPEQYVGLYDELLKINLTIIDSHWYIVDDNMNAHPIHPKYDVHEVWLNTPDNNLKGRLKEYLDAQEEEKQIRKSSVPLPVLRTYAAIGSGISHYRLFQRKQKYPNHPQGYFDEWIIDQISQKPTSDIFGYSLEVLGCARRTLLHWIEAGKEKECVNYAESIG
ncbi:hypothetical protein, partial [Vibrio cholerae]|uniref:hypothetical protein n=1 Tax=Vibrio cholerae TaxID=666 RepID=UPI0021AED651